MVMKHKLNFRDEWIRITRSAKRVAGSIFIGQQLPHLIAYLNGIASTSLKDYKVKVLENKVAGHGGGKVCSKNQ